MSSYGSKLANKLYIVVVEKEQNTAFMLDVEIPVGSNIRKKECERTEKYQRLKEQLEPM